MLLGASNIFWNDFLDNMVIFLVITYTVQPLCNNLLHLTYVNPLGVKKHFFLAPCWVRQSQNLNWWEGFFHMPYLWSYKKMNCPFKKKKNCKFFFTSNCWKETISIYLDVEKLHFSSEAYSKMNHWFSHMLR